MKAIRVMIPVFMLSVLGLAWYNTVSTVSTEASTYDRYIAEGNAAFEKTHFQEAYLAYEKALGVKKTEAAQDKILAAYAARSKETEEYDDFDRYVDASAKACSRFSGTLKYYENTMELMLTDSRYDDALGIYRQAGKNHLSSEKLTTQYRSVIGVWKIYKAGVKEYTEPFNGCYSYSRENGWSVYNLDTRKDVVRACTTVGRAGDDGIFFSSGTRDANEFVDTAGVVRGKLKSKVEAAGIYREGLAPVKIEGNYRYTDLDGQKTFGAYRFAGTFYKGVAPVQLGSDDWTLIDKDGNTVTDNLFDRIVLNTWDSCSAGPNRDLVIAQKDGVFAIYDAHGKEAKQTLDCEDMDIVADDNLFAAKKGGTWGFMNSGGEWIIEPSYDGAKSFACGLAAVKEGENWKLINRAQETVAEGNFAEIGYMNKDGSVFVRTKDDKGVAGTYYDWLKFPYFSQLTAEG